MNASTENVLNNAYSIHGTYGNPPPPPPPPHPSFLAIYGELSMEPPSPSILPFWRSTVDYLWNPSHPSFLALYGGLSMEPPILPFWRSTVDYLLSNISIRFLRQGI